MAEISTYTHVQSIPSSSWTINHNLGSKPMAETLLEINGTMQKVFPLSVTHSSDNTTVITWSVPRVGRVLLSTAA